METVPPIKKKSSIISWIGFGIAVAVFVLIWFVNILVFQWSGQPANAIGALYMITILLGSILGILAMVFSIVGLILAIKNDTPKWIGTTGIVLCIASIISFFLPIFCAGLKQKEPVQVVTPEYLKENNVIIQINKYGKVRCLDNRRESNNVVGNMQTYKYDFEQQLQNWLKLNNVDESAELIIQASKDADYSDINKVFNALQKAGLTKFTLKSDLEDSADRD